MTVKSKPDHVEKAEITRKHAKIMQIVPAVAVVEARGCGLSLCSGVCQSELMGKRTTPLVGADQLHRALCSSDKLLIVAKMDCWNQIKQARIGYSSVCGGEPNVNKCSRTLGCTCSADEPPLWLYNPSSEHDSSPAGFVFAHIDCKVVAGRLN